MSTKKTLKQQRKQKKSRRKARLHRRDDHTNENVQRHNPRCRFCFQGNRDEGVRGRMIVACGCRNEGRYVHYQPCLGQHLETHMDRPCMICGQLFKNIKIERYKYCPTFWLFFKRAWNNCYPNTPVLRYIKVFAAIEIVLIILMPIIFAPGSHPIRHDFFKGPESWIILFVAYFTVMSDSIRFSFARYKIAHPEANIFTFIWRSLRRYDQDSVTLYYCLVALAILVLFCSLLIFNFTFFHYFKDVSEMDDLFVICISLIVAMVSFFAVHYEYVKFKRYHYYPHDMIRFRQWHGSINNERIIDITDLKRKAAAHIQAQNQYQAMIQQTLEEIAMEEDPAVMEFLNWQLDWDNMTEEEKKEEEQYEDFVRNFYHYYLVRQRNHEWAPELTFNEAVIRVFDLIDEHDIPYDAMPFNLVMEDIVAAVPDY